MSYWESTEARKIFKPVGKEKDALEAINNQLDLLLCVLEAPKGYLHVVTGIQGDDDELSEYQQWLVQLKCQLICCALYHVKEKMPMIQNWDECCKLAKEQAVTMGIRVAQCSRTVRNWYLEFRMNNRSFNIKAPAKHSLAPFLDENKDVCEWIKQYARENLPELSIELMSEYIHNIVIPSIIKERSAVEPSEGEKYEKEMRDLLREYGLKTICPSTIYRWLKKLGFVYEPRKKGYYVDGHEKPSTVEYQNNFVK